MTNLEEWIDDMKHCEWKEEVFSKIFSQLVRCNECPASEKCKQATDVDYEPDDIEEDCKAHFLKWAIEPAKEN